MNGYFDCIASAAFGMEGLVASELRNLSAQNVSAENGCVRFSANPEELFIFNLSLRYCDRVFILLAEEKCLSFESLFQLAGKIPWEKYVTGLESIDVSAKCARSRLMSPRDCQSITKKAIIERLKKETKRSSFPETGPSFPILVSIHSDLVRIMLNTSGEALSRRGYRTWNGEAPLRETLAAALVKLSPWKPGLPLYDPCCGTGTILIEAAFMAAGRLPGLYRHFAMEQFCFCRFLHFDKIRNEAEKNTHAVNEGMIAGSDLDVEAVKLSCRHIKQAGLEGRIHVSPGDLSDLQLSETSGVFICNPPYGERMSNKNSVHYLYENLRKLKDRHPSWSFCAITSDPAFERYFGLRADKKRRLYNGRLECVYYIYYGSPIHESD